MFIYLHYIIVTPSTWDLNTWENKQTNEHLKILKNDKEKPKAI